MESGRIVGAWPVCLDDGLLSQPCVVYLFRSVLPNGLGFRVHLVQEEPRSIEICYDLVTKIGFVLGSGQTWRRTLLLGHEGCALDGVDDPAAEGVPM